VIPIFQIDAFAERPFGGNPAAVVIDAQRLSAAQMQAIAFEMRVAGTAFLGPATRPGAHWGLRWFTPTREIAYSGHTTLAAVHALVESGRTRGDRIVFETLSGLLQASVVEGRQRRLIWLEPKVPELHPFTGQLAHVREALGLSAAAGWAPAVTTPDHDLLVPVAGLDVLRTLRPNLAALADVATHAGVRGVCLVSRETVDQGSTTHCRFFAPHFGIPEDIVTGSVHSSIGIWLFAAGLLHANGALADFTAEQGDGLGRPGRLRVELLLQAGAVARVRVGGSAATVLAGSIAVPDR
jgi:trans-2,3-dihydro-3-hydroxyanthranilate isomerase